MAEYSILSTPNPAEWSVDIDRTPIRVGMVFYTYGVKGTIKGGRIYIEDVNAQPPLNLDGCWGLLYRLNTSSSTLLAAKAFGTGLTSGWNDLRFNTPVVTDASFIGAPAYYGFVVYMPNGGYSYRPVTHSVELHSAGWDPLTAATSAEINSWTSGFVLGNGIFSGGSVADPSSPANNPASWGAFNHTNYGIDVIVDDVVSTTTSRILGPSSRMLKSGTRVLGPSGRVLKK